MFKNFVQKIKTVVKNNVVENKKVYIIMGMQASFLIGVGIACVLITMFSKDPMSMFGRNPT